MTLDAAAIAALLPHTGRMCLLDQVLTWDEDGILCLARSHVDPSNPLRRGDSLPALCGLEYPLQAAALHGALVDGAIRRGPGYVAVVRDVTIHVARLDDAGFGALRAEARLEHRAADSRTYALTLAATDGRVLLSGSAMIAFGGAA